MPIYTLQYILRLTKKGRKMYKKFKLETGVKSGENTLFYINIMYFACWWFQETR